MGAYDPYTPIDEINVSAERRNMLGSPSSVPAFTLHRTVEDAIDAGPDVPVVASAGMNMKGFDEAVIQVVPKAGAAILPGIEVYQWSESAGTFVPFVAAKTATAPAVLTPYTFQTEVFGAIIWVRVTGTMTTSDVVEILVAGAITGKKE
jgi:phage tail sheath gpL-like